MPNQTNQTKTVVIPKDKEDVVKQALVTARENKSAAMRSLADAGFSTGDISRILTKAGFNVSYQFVRNVLTRGAPKSDAKDERIAQLEAETARLQAELDAASKGKAA